MCNMICANKYRVVNILKRYIFYKITTVIYILF
nr:MAG TPA: hypothetical protein [Caudoviricetes sp.]